jgi:allantoinase
MVESGNTLYKVFPPIRRREHRYAIWENLKKGVLNFVTSGHMPTALELKGLEDGDFYRAFCGMISIEVMLPAFFTECLRQTKEACDDDAREDKDITESTLLNLVEYMCERPAKFLGLERVKGSLEIGKDADIVVWSPESTFIVNSMGHQLQSKVRRSIWDGQNLRGVVRRTFVRGTCVFEGGEEGCDLDQSSQARFPTEQHPSGMVIKGSMSD